MLPASNAVGTVYILDAGTKVYTGSCKIANGGTNLGLYVDNNSNGIGPTIPHAWAVNDQLIASIVFPITDR